MLTYGYRFNLEDLEKLSVEIMPIEQSVWEQNCDHVPDSIDGSLPPWIFCVLVGTSEPVPVDVLFTTKEISNPTVKLLTAVTRGDITYRVYSLQFFGQHIWLPFRKTRLK